MFVIKSGQNGNTANVNSLGELHTFAVTESIVVRKALESKSYIITTPIINLTSDTLSHVFFMNNSDLFPWIVIDAFFRYGVSDGSGDFRSVGTLNPTGGTLLTGGTAFFPSNLDLANQVPLPGTFLYGQEGDTATGGLGSGEILVQENRAQEGAIPVILRPGTSLAFGVEPPSGNTSMNVQVSYEIIRDV